MTGRSLAYVSVVMCILLSLVAAQLVQPVLVLAAAPETPANVSPSNGATVDTLTPTLRASGFEDSDGDSHIASVWRIAGQEYADSSGDLTSFDVPAGLLDFSTEYGWQVSYCDNTSQWSGWSSAWSFTTMSEPEEPPVVATADASAVGTTSATLNGNLANPGTADSVNVSFQWGTSNSYGQTVSAGTMTAGGPLSATLNGLAPGTTYHFRAVAAGDGTVSGSDRTFTTGVEPPEVTTAAASPIGSTSATLNGNLANPGTAASVSVSFQWGTSNSYGQTVSAGTMTAGGPLSATLNGLAPGTTYHFRAVAAGDGTVSGSDRTFTTGVEPPEVTTAAASPIGSTSATLNGNLANPGTAASVSVSFQWGTSNSYGQTVSAGTMTAGGPLSATLNGLAPGTTYHFRAVAAGDGTVSGSDRTFTTSAAPTEPPTVITGAASAIGTTSATVNLNLAGLGSAASVRVYFEWGLTTEYGNTTTPRTMSRTGSSSFALSGLSLETTYHFRARADGDGAARGEDLSFTTSGAPAAPPAVATLSAGDIGTNSATLNLDLTGLGSAAAVQVSFEWGLTTDYGQSTSAQAMEGTGVLGQAVTGLAAASTYHFRAVAVGDGTAYGSDLTFTTGYRPAVAPKVRTDDADTITGGSARLGGELTSLGTARSATVSFVWGTSPGGPYPNETPGIARTENGTFYTDLDGLALGTTYYLQARAGGDGVSCGVEKSFTTRGIAPRIDSLMAYKGQQGPSLMLKITGSNLSNATQVDLRDGITVRGFTVVSESEIRAEVIVEGSAKSGARQLAVTTPSGTAYYSVPAGFLAGVPGDAAEPDDSPRASMWIYLVVVAVGLVGALLIVPLEVALWRRHKK